MSDLALDLRLTLGEFELIEKLTAGIDLHGRQLGNRPPADLRGQREHLASAAARGGRIDDLDIPALELPIAMSREAGRRKIGVLWSD